ncbi:MAG: hypothetical protein K0R98_1838 [Rickettsiaceae bacterium]|jgi:hypothetical protein|nr:hypothetical protein [Rickettsiaceae bacterium]
MKGNEFLNHVRNLFKPGGKLEQWYTLDFATFVAKLTKKKISLTLAR